MGKIIAILLLAVSNLLGQWFPYTPENSEYPQRVGVHDIATLNMLTSATPTQPATIRTFVRVVAINPYAYNTPATYPSWAWVGDIAGEWFVWIDLNPAYTPAPTSIQVWGLTSVDRDLYYGTLFQSVPIQHYASLLYTSWWGLFTFYSGVIYQYPNQAGGSSFVYLPEASAGDIHIATWTGPPIYYGISRQVDVHVVGNIYSELEGSGWIYFRQTVNLSL